MSRRAVAHAIVDEPQAWEAVPTFILSPGLWKMRNGHTAKITARFDIPYQDGMTGKPKVYSIWKGCCVECGQPMTWNFVGSYAAIGRHRNDITGPA